MVTFRLPSLYCVRHYLFPFQHAYFYLLFMSPHSQDPVFCCTVCGRPVMNFSLPMSIPPLGLIYQMVACTLLYPINTGCVVPFTQHTPLLTPTLGLWDYRTRTLCFPFIHFVGDCSAFLYLVLVPTFPMSSSQILCVPFYLLLLPLTTLPYSSVPLCGTCLCACYYLTFRRSVPAHHFPPLQTPHLLLLYCTCPHLPFSPIPRCTTLRLLSTRTSHFFLYWFLPSPFP